MEDVERRVSIQSIEPDVLLKDKYVKLSLCVLIGVFFNFNLLLSFA